MLNRYVDIGEIWAYRSQARNPQCPVERVEIIERGPSRSSNFLVRFPDEAERQEWVPRNRLLTPWADRDPWLADEQRMTAVVRVSRHAEDTPQYAAVEYVLEAWDLIQGVEIGFGERESGCVKINNVHDVCDAVGLDAREIEAGPLMFTDRLGIFIAPWPVALEIAERVARTNADTVMNKVMLEEEELKLAAIHGRSYRNRAGEITRIPAEDCVESCRREQAVLDVIRGWCGTEVIKRLDELEALRTEVRRLGRLVEQAIRELQRCGQEAIAATMERDLGVPISMLMPPRRRRS